MLKQFVVVIPSVLTTVNKNDKFNPPIPIRAWEVNLSENWQKGICDHAPDEDHMGFELLKYFSCSRNCRFSR